MKTQFHNIPNRLAPYILMDALNQLVEVVTGRFELATEGKTLGTVEARLYLRWSPTTAMEFDGIYTGARIDLSAQNVTLSLPVKGLSAPVIITNAPALSASGQIRGVFRHRATVATRPVFDRLRFCLVNFPEYNGDPIRYETEHSRRDFRGRLQASSSRFSLMADAIPEVADLRKAADRDAGFVISHVGELKPQEGHLDEASSEEVLDLMHLFFGFLRGACSGPVFSQGFAGNEKIWEQLAGWKVSEAKEVRTWMPQRHPLEFDGLFEGFAELYYDQAWSFPLKRALDWYVQANSSDTPSWTKLVLSQIALELLAWTELVTAHRHQSRTGFDKLSAADRIRKLLQRLQIPCEIPSHFKELETLQNDDALDGPGVVARLRNSLVHSGEKKPSTLRFVSGEEWCEVGQLALYYVELSLLALCGYQGLYARRGWKGDDEVPVPWAQAG